MSICAAIESGTAPYVRVASGLLALGEPPIVPTSAARFHRGVAPRSAIPDGRVPTARAQARGEVAGPPASRPAGDCTEQGPAACELSTRPNGAHEERA